MTIPSFYQAPVPGFRSSRQAPATDVVGALNQLNATLRGLKALLNERLIMPEANEPTNDVY